MKKEPSDFQRKLNNSFRQNDFDLHTALSVCIEDTSIEEVITVISWICKERDALPELEKAIKLNFK